MAGAGALASESQHMGATPAGEHFIEAQLRDLRRLGVVCRGLGGGVLGDLRRDLPSRRLRGAAGLLRLSGDSPSFGR